MPIQYTGILDEHRAVREAAGLFDVSHMGEFRVRGPAGARPRPARSSPTTCRSWRTAARSTPSCATTAAAPSTTCWSTGSRPTTCMLVVNAANIATDWAHVSAQAARPASTRDAHQRVRRLGAARAAGADGVRRVRGRDRARRLRHPVLPLPHDGAGRGVRRRPRHRLAHRLHGRARPRALPQPRGGRAGLGRARRRPARRRPGSARATRCASRPATASTATSSTATRRRSKPAWAGSSSPTPATSSGATRSSRQKATGTERKLVGLVVEGRGIPRAGHPIVDARRGRGRRGHEREPVADAGPGGRAGVRPERPRTTPRSAPSSASRCAGACCRPS